MEHARSKKNYNSVEILTISISVAWYVHVHAIISDWFGQL